MNLFKKLVTTELEQLPIRKVYEQRDLRRGLETLKNRTNIVIRPADKGGGIVVLSLDQYKGEMNRLLEVSDTYRLLTSNPSKSVREELERIIRYGIDNQLLSKNEAEYLIPTVSKIPVIYYLPKIHKNSINPPPPEDQ